MWWMGRGPWFPVQACLHLWSSMETQVQHADVFKSTVVVNKSCLIVQSDCKTTCSPCHGDCSTSRDFYGFIHHPDRLHHLLEKVCDWRCSWNLIESQHAAKSIIYLSAGCPVRKRRTFRFIPWGDISNLTRTVKQTLTDLLNCSPTVLFFFPCFFLFAEPKCKYKSVKLHY